MKKTTGSTQFNCFSPPVMVATLIIESSLAAYTVFRYKMSSLNRLMTLALVALATFQLSEYFVCTGYGISAGHWSRIGFAAIATLPPLGLHIMHVIANKPKRQLVYTAYGSMVAFVGVFMLYRTAFIGHQCTGNYVIFQVGPQLGGAFFLYYYFWLIVAILLGAHWANQLKEQGQIARKKLEAVRAMIIGYLVFMVPTAIANTVQPSTKAGIPSVMCGFAVLFALILALYIAPRQLTQKEAARQPRKTA